MFFPVDSGVCLECVLAWTGLWGLASLGHLLMRKDTVILAERLCEESECLGLSVSYIKTKIQVTAVISVTVCKDSVDFIYLIDLGSDVHASGACIWFLMLHCGP